MKRKYYSTIPTKQTSTYPLNSLNTTSWHITFEIYVLVCGRDKMWRVS